MSDAEKDPVQPTESSQETSKYKAPWVQFERNQAFWEEVLKGRTIVDLHWDDKGIAGLKLDSGELVYLTGTSGRICIQDGV